MRWRVEICRLKSLDSKQNSPEDFAGKEHPTMCKHHIPRFVSSRSGTQPFRCTYEDTTLARLNLLQHNLASGLFYSIHLARGLVCRDWGASSLLVSGLVLWVYNIIAVAAAGNRLMIVNHEFYFNNGGAGAGVSYFIISKPKRLRVSWLRNRFIRHTTPKSRSMSCICACV